MRRKTLFWAAVVMVSMGGLLTALVFMLRYEPNFYRNKEMPAGPQRTQQSKEGDARLATLFLEITQDAPSWQASLSEAQLNSYLQERFLESGVAATVLPRDISAPRIAIEGDTLRLGFRYGTPPWSTVISADFRIWQAPKEPNVVALQLLGVRAGMIPLTSKFLLDKVNAIVRSQNNDIDVTWYRHEGCLVALLRFGASKPRQTNLLEQLRVGEGKIIIAGRSLNAAPPINPAAAAPKK